RPSLDVVVQLESSVEPDGKTGEVLTFFLVNRGRGIARYIGFICRFEDGIRVGSVHGNGLANETAFNNGIPTVAFANDVGVVHPEGPYVRAGAAFIQRKEVSEPLRVQITVYCENMRRETRLKAV